MSHVFEDIDISSVTLTEVYIQALSADSYTTTTSGSSVFQNWLSSLGPVERGTVYATKSLAPLTTLATFSDQPGQTLRYLIRSTAPTLRGTVCKNTEVLISPRDHITGALDDGQSQKVTNPSLEGYEIDEAFMENGMLFAANRGHNLRKVSRPQLNVSLSPTLTLYESDLILYQYCHVPQTGWKMIIPSTCVLKTSPAVGFSMATGSVCHQVSAHIAELRTVDCTLK